MVELLVVVSILALLMVVLLPSLAGAREQAKAAVCASNLRQIALANELYANEHGHRYSPGAADFLDNLHRWHGRRDHPSQPFDGRGGPLVPYLGHDGEIRACPTFRTDVPEDGTLRFERNCGGYGYNQAFLGRRLEDAGFGFFKLVDDKVGVLRDRVSSPPATIMFADTAFVNTGLIEYSFAEPRFFPLWGTRPDPSIHFRHDGFANVAWCDGHVDRRARTFTWSSGFYAGDPDRSNLGWFGKGDDNSLFDLE